METDQIQPTDRKSIKRPNENVGINPKKIALEPNFVEWIRVEVTNQNINSL